MILSSQGPSRKLWNYPDNSANTILVISPVWIRQLWLLITLITTTVITVSIASKGWRCWTNLSLITQQRSETKGHRWHNSGNLRSETTFVDATSELDRHQIFKLRLLHLSTKIHQNRISCGCQWNLNSNTMLQQLALSKCKALQLN